MGKACGGLTLAVLIGGSQELDCLDHVLLWRPCLLPWLQALPQAAMGACCVQQELRRRRAGSWMRPDAVVCRVQGSDYKSQINYERIAQQDKDREDQRLAGGAMLQMVHMAPSHPGAGSMASQQPPIGQPNPAWGHAKVDQPSAGTPPYQQLHHGKANNGKGQRLV